jgi:hypothetical protein
MKKSKKIEYSNGYDGLEFFVPSKECIADWYKQAPRFIDDKINIDSRGSANKNFKLCIPFLDSMLSGYTVISWQESLFKYEDGRMIATWPGDPEIIGVRDKEMSKGIPVPAGHLDKSFWWYMPFSIKLPKGYSLLITHPLNRYDLPFTTMSAIVDADEIMTDGKIPFFIKEDFEGIIPKGTPLFQVIPFKRDNWQKVENNNLIEYSKKFYVKVQTLFYGYYKNHVWKKKDYR